MSKPFQDHPYPWTLSEDGCIITDGNGRTVANADDSGGNVVDIIWAFYERLSDKSLLELGRARAFQILGVKFLSGDCILDQENLINLVKSMGFDHKYVDDVEEWIEDASIGDYYDYDYGSIRINCVEAKKE
jgi:hypothetical protein